VCRRDEKEGGHVVEHIYQHDPDEPGESSPLVRPGVGVKYLQKKLQEEPVEPVLPPKFPNQAPRSKVGER
jgi:hypothetical protein